MFTLRAHRLRRGPYGLAPSEDQPNRLVRTVLILVAAGIVLYFGRSFLLWITSGNVVERAAATMTVEVGGPVSFAIEGGSMRRAEDTLKLAEGDRIETGGGGRARLSFFDESVAMVDENSTVTLEESARGSTESTLTMSLGMGALWLKTGDTLTLSGTIVRTIETPAFTATVPNNAEIIVRNRSIDVFAADGLGVEIAPEGASTVIFIGEGQRWELSPDADVDGDLYVMRTPLPVDAAAQTLVTRGRSAVIAAASANTSSAPAADTEVLVITAPAKNASIAAATVRVEGRVGPLVTRVRVNGYQAALDLEKRMFTQDLAFTDETPFILHIEAMDADNVVIAEEQRSVTRNEKPAAAPTITEPSGDGSTYRTQATELIIKGTTPQGTVGIIVNDYRLQLYEAGSTTWSYLADTKLGNFKSGANTFDVIAIDAAGNQSAPVRITILMEEGTAGVVGGASSLPASQAGAASTGAAASASSAFNEDETILPKNAPLAPGTITITGPGPSPFTTGSGEILIEGTTSADTDSVWINGYHLRLYVAGKTTWNYIASTQYSTLKRGSNTYIINVRNAKGEIIDTEQYVVTYEP